MRDNSYTCDTTDLYVSLELCVGVKHSFVARSHSRLRHDSYMCDMTDVCVTWLTRSWLEWIQTSDMTRVCGTRRTSIIALKYAIKQSTRSWLDDILYSYSDMTRVRMTRLTSIIALHSFTTHTNDLLQCVGANHSFVTRTHSRLRNHSCMCDMTEVRVTWPIRSWLVLICDSDMTHVCVTRLTSIRLSNAFEHDVVLCIFQLLLFLMNVSRVSVWQCVAVCCSVFHRVAVCCIMLQCVAVWCRPVHLSTPALSDVCVMRRFVTVCCSVLQRVVECAPMCCSVFHRVAVYCSMMSSSVFWSRALSDVCVMCDCVAVCCSVLQRIAVCSIVLQCVPSCCSVLHRVTVCCSMMSSSASFNSCSFWCMCHAWLCCSVLQCVAVCCSVLQCVAVCCSVLYFVAVY